jgi:conjugative relaxase-like TrwC/TraI family protein
MLSLANVKSGLAAATYYESTDDYYFKDCSPSSWYGAGAKALGLVGQVNHEVFTNLLEGHLPDGSSLHNAAAGRRAGTDATFSAPKSVSLQSLVGGDQRIIMAHRIAVDRTLAYAEQFSACRVTRSAATVSERTGTLLVARFDHDLSRTCDPQLHTHCVLINATLREDGEWRALDNQFIYRRKMLLGAYYRAELARELLALGYGIRLTNLDGRFELSHIDDAQVCAFSSRSNEIEAYLKDRGLTRNQAPAELKKLIALITRVKKTEVDRSQLLQVWSELSDLNAINYQPANHHESLVADPDCSQRILQDAIAHLSERKAVFDHIALSATALAAGVGRLTLPDVEHAIDQAIESGVLIRVGENYTTNEMLRLETEILAMELAGRESMAPVFKGLRIDLESRLSGLSDGQRAAALGILISRNRVTGIQGRAGTGKTTLLREAAAIALAAGYQIKGLAPSASAARELETAGIGSETIAAFGRRTDKRLSARTLLIVDEAGMASNRQMHSIMAAATEAGCRVVLVGDTAQLKAVEAGKPFAQLQSAGMHTSLVSEIQRQKNSNLKRAVELSVDGQVGMAVELLKKEVKQISDSNDRFEQIAQDYAALTVDEREQALVVAGTRWARSEINQRIRSKLGLAGSGMLYVLLERKDHTASQLRSILAYESGDIMIAESDYKSLGLRRGESARVIGRSGAEVILQRSDGKQVAWKPVSTTNLKAYTSVQRELAVGELVRVTTNDRQNGLTNGDIGRVLILDSGSYSLTLALKDGRKVVLDSRKPLPLTHGYCSTVNSAQGQTCERVFVEAETNSLTANRSTFYVAISRARQFVTIYTDDREMLPLAMTREIFKESALELVSNTKRQETEYCHE